MLKGSEGVVRTKEPRTTPLSPCTSGEKVRVRGVNVDFSLTLSLSRRERERRLIVIATCLGVP